MQCEDCKLKNKCGNFGIEEIKNNYFSCTDYVSETSMPAHTHPVFTSLFRNRDNGVNRSSDDMLCNIVDSTGQRD